MASLIVTVVAKAARKLVSFTPRHIRRMVLWCSLYTRMRNTTSADKLNCGQLNDTMHLVTQVKALDFPVWASRLIWTDVSSCYEAVRKAIFQSGSLSTNTKEFVSAIPQWLRYGSDEKMERDFIRMVKNHPTVAA